MESIRHLLIIFLATTLALAFSPPSPPSQEICKRNPHHISSARRSGDGGYEVFVEGQVEEFKSGAVYTVGIRATEEDLMFNGFMLTAVASNMQPIGYFMNLNPYVTKEIRWCPAILSHVDFRLKREVKVQWRAPMEKGGCVEFRATVMEQSNSWFKDEGKLTKIFCPEEIPEQPMDEGPCCACGSAKYEMLFEGIWSDQSHPTNYPTQKRLLHWSNIVGASHNDQYHIWKLGGTATKGVKEICELGYPRTLEGEIKKQSRDVRTLIKTTGIWWKDPHGIVQNRTARFTTDTKRHFVSVITMLGPSPDWCVGISRVNVCQKNCTWSDGFVVDLTPWDAGTDDGISYMSPNAKSDPQRKIRKITNMWPTDPQSPFFGPNPITPVARLHVRKIGDTKPSNPEQCDESSLTDFIGDASSNTQQQTISANCMVSEWEDWSKCSVTCGVGTRSRRRMYKKAGSEEDCDVTLLEKENCIGIENECESIDEDCAMTQWSDWSPCSVTCGQGHREKLRYYFEAEDEKRCNRSRSFREVCYGAIEDCRMAKKSSAVCLLPSYKGPCRANFRKWYYDQAMKKCLQFDYGGCRGNENRFESMEKCMEVCEEEESEDKTFCMVPSDRGTCGKRMEKWYFDKSMQKCLPFEYSGCGGNKNRFESMDECSDSCQLAGLEGGGGDDMVMKCQQPALEGTCNQDLERWYFDTQMQKCLPFQYGGCGSNDNNFVTMDECTDLCTLNAQLQDAILKKEINPGFLQLTNQGGERGHSRYKRFCTLPQQRGPCRDNMERWYFDLSMLTCLSFVYGGCVGNANNFESIQQCEQSCLGKVMTENFHMTNQSSIQYEKQQNDEMYMKKMMMEKKMMEKRKMENNEFKNKRMNKSKTERNMMKQRMKEVNMMKKEMMKKEMMKKEMMDKNKMEKEKMMTKGMMKEGKMEEGSKKMRKKGERVVCVVSEWSSWSSCSATCGRGHQTMTRRILEKKVAKVGKKCPRRLTRKKRCRNAYPCEKDCVYMRWSRWSPCSSSCGPSIKQRYSKSLATRSVANRHQHRTNYYPNADRFNRGKQTSNKECPDKIQRALCKLSSCPM